MAYKCRICNRKVDDIPLIIFENMPPSAQNFQDFGKKPDIQNINLYLYQCVGCGVVQHFQEPVSYYKEVIRSNAFSIEMQDFRNKQLKTWIEVFNLKNKKILEIGCGSGEYIEIIKKHSDNVLGIEYNENSVKNCQDKKLNVYKYYLEDSDKPLQLQKIDAFVIFNFLEHWPNPIKCFENLSKSLNNNAVGIIEVPNFEMIVEKGLFSEFILDHVFYFDRKSFVNALNIFGFEVISIQEIWNNYILSAKVKRRQFINISKMFLYRKNNARANKFYQ